MRVAGFLVLMVVPLVGAGAGVFGLLDNTERLSNGAADAAMVVEQIQVLAIVAAQAQAPDSNLREIRQTGLDAGIKAQATMDRLVRSRLAPGEVQPLNRRLGEYYASLAVADQLFTQHDLANARRVAAGTDALVGPITALANKLASDLHRKSDSAAGAARVLIVALLAAVVFLMTGVVTTLQRKRRKDAVRAAAYDARSHFEAMVEHSRDVAIVTTLTGDITYVSPALSAILGYDRDEWVGSIRRAAVHPDDQPIVAAAFRRNVEDATPATIDIRMRHADESWRTMEAGITRMADGDASAVLWTCRDVTTKRELEEQLRRQAFQDGLTGLANRTLLLDRLDQAISRGVRAGEEVAVLLLDVDRFKDINDSFGHPAGDAALIDLASRLVAAVRDGDTVARIGGDEFVVVAEATDARWMATELINRIQRGLQHGFAVGETTVRMTVSVGVVVVRGDRDANDVIRDADVAMYAAKADGRDQMVVFEPAMLRSAQTNTELTIELDGAADRGELELHYQPIYDLTTLSVVGAEALVRWRHPTRGMIGPDVFIPIAERAGEMVPIGRWVLNEACRQTAVWAAADRSGFRTMHINISGRQLMDPSLVDDVRGAISSAGLDPHLVVLEVTESVLMRDASSAVQVLGQLRSEGVRIGIDDFGTGYSSLARLGSFPADVVKIDRAFVNAASDGTTTDRAILDGIFDLTDRLHMTTVAEGIERADQLDNMRQHGCVLGQGFLMSRPVPASRFPLPTLELAPVPV